MSTLTHWCCDGTDQHGSNVRAWSVWKNPSVFPLFNLDIRLYYTIVSDVVSHTTYGSAPNTTPQDLAVDSLLGLVAWWRGKTSAAQGGQWPSETHKPFRWGLVLKGIDSGSGSTWYGSTKLLFHDDDALDPSYATPSGIMSTAPVRGVRATKAYFDALWPYLAASCGARNLPLPEIIAGNNENYGDLINNAYASDGQGGYNNGPYYKAVNGPTNRAFLVDGSRTAMDWHLVRGARPDGTPYPAFTGNHQADENFDQTQRSVSLFTTARLQALNAAVYDSARRHLGCRCYEWGTPVGSRTSPAFLYGLKKTYDQDGFMPLDGCVLYAYGQPSVGSFGTTVADIVARYGHAGAVGGTFVEQARAARDFTVEWAEQCYGATGKRVVLYPQIKHTSADAGVRKRIAHINAEMIASCCERAGTRDVVIYQDNADGQGDLESGTLSASRRQDVEEMCRAAYLRTVGRSI